MMASVWSGWRSPADEKVPTCTIITTEANAAMAMLRSPMPVILRESNWSAWLGEQPATDDHLKQMMTLRPADQLNV